MKSPTLLFLFLPIILTAAPRSTLAPSGPTAAADGWTEVSPREEIRPAFSYDEHGGPNHSASLGIRADDREGLDGTWTKSFPVKGGAYYSFRALRRVENVPFPRRSTLARILWRDAKGQPVHRD